MNHLTIHVEIEQVDGEERYCASVKEMPGCFTEASNLETLLFDLYDAMDLWTDANLESKS